MGETVYEVADVLVKHYNDFIEAYMTVNKHRGHEHICTEQQNFAMERYRQECVRVLASIIASDKIGDYEDVKRYEARKGETVSLEDIAIGRIIFDLSWLKFLTKHCGERKYGWYLKATGFLLKMIESEELRTKMHDDCITWQEKRIKELKNSEDSRRQD